LRYPGPAQFGVFPLFSVAQKSVLAVPSSSGVRNANINRPDQSIDSRDVEESDFRRTWPSKEATRSELCCCVHRIPRPDFVPSTIANVFVDYHQLCRESAPRQPPRAQPPISRHLRCRVALCTVFAVTCDSALVSELEVTNEPFDCHSFRSQIVPPNVSILA
jgi:hypothetical protein